MSYSASTPPQRRECALCGWRQTGGRGETVLACPGCGATSWRSVR